jgi:hypothetical protein
MPQRYRSHAFNKWFLTRSARRALMWTLCNLPMVINIACMSFQVLSFAIQVHFSGNNLYGIENSGLSELKSKKAVRVVLPKFSSFRTRFSFPRCNTTLIWLSKCRSNLCTVVEHVGINPYNLQQASVVPHDWRFSNSAISSRGGGSDRLAQVHQVLP